MKTQKDQWRQAIDNITARNKKGMEKELQKVYTQALRNIKKDLKQYVDNYETLSFSQRMQVEHTIKMADQIQAQFNDANVAANNTIHQGKAKAIELGYYGEWFAQEGTHRIQMDLPILNKRLVEQLTYNKVNGRRLSDRLYKNTQKLADRATEDILQGTIRGKGYAEIAEIMERHTEATYKQALRIAWTESSQAQSVARQKEYEEAKEKGLEMTKTWLATLDKRTRHHHGELDGQTVEVEEEFEIPSSGAKALGPGQFGIAKEDIHCRCTTIVNVDGIPPEFRRIDGEIVEFKTYDQWATDKGFKKPADIVAETIKDTSKISQDIGLVKKLTEEEMARIKKELAEENEQFGSAGNFKNWESTRQLTPEEVAEVRKELKMEETWESLTKKQQAAIYEYTGSNYDIMNRILRLDDDSMFGYVTKEKLASLKDSIAEVQKALNSHKTTQDLILHRNVQNTKFFGFDPENGITEFVDKGFVSTTPLPRSSDFTGAVIKTFEQKGRAFSEMIEIQVPKGTKGMFVGTNSASHLEEEFILPAGTKFEYVSEKMVTFEKEIYEGFTETYKRKVLTVKVVPK